MKKIIEEIKKLKSVPQVTHKIMALAGDPTNFPPDD